MAGSYCTALEHGLLGLRFGDTAYTAPSTEYLGLILASNWAASTVISSAQVTAGYYVVSPTHFDGPGTVNTIFKCTTAGTTGATEPTWNTGAGSTTTDNTATWTEVSSLFAATTITGAEASGGAYARVSIANNTTNWPTPTGTDPAQTDNGAVIAWPQSNAAYSPVNVVGLLGGFTAATGGSPDWWCTTNSRLAVASANITPQIAVGNLISKLS